MADVIIAKHRNGPIGTRKLVFLDRFPKFADHSGQDAPIERRPARAAVRRRQRRGARLRCRAIARWEPFRDQSARSASATARAGSSAPRTSRAPAVPRTAAGKRRNRGLASVIPAQYRGVSFDRPPVSDMARDLETKAAVSEVRSYIDELEERLDEGRGLWLFGDTGTGKTTLAMLVSKAALEAGHSVAIYSLPKLLARSADLRRRTRRRLLPHLLRSPDLGRPPPHRRPRRRETLRLGPRAALRPDQRALRGPALDNRHDEPHARRARGADRPPHGLPPHRDLRRSAGLRRRPALARGRVGPPPS